MSAKITPDHLGRSAVVYVRQSTMSQVMGNLESQRRQYDLAGAAQSAGFISVTVIDDELGRSGSGSIAQADALQDRRWRHLDDSPGARNARTPGLGRTQPRRCRNWRS
jgi:hypothetical protein